MGSASRFSSVWSSAVLGATLLAGCASGDVKYFTSSYRAPYQPPTSGPVATLHLAAPGLKDVLGLADEVQASFYDSCATGGRKEEGYLGDVELSSDPEVGKEREVTVAAGKPIYFEIGYTQAVECTSKFVLQPREGAKYGVVYVYSGGNCYADAFAIGQDGTPVESADLEYRSNRIGWPFKGASGSTSTEWRQCQREPTPSP